SGHQVTWIAFSEDDAWLGAVQASGAAFAFDVASGNSLVAGQMLNEFEPREIAISHRDRLVVVAGYGESMLWRVADDGPNVREATPVMSAPSSARAGTTSLAISLESSLMATASFDGEVRLWRAPKPVLIRTLVGGSWSATSLDFDGQHLPDAAYNYVRVLSTAGGPHGPWLALPQPVA